MTSGLGEMCLKNGSVGPARPCCFPVLKRCGKGRRGLPCLYSFQKPATTSIIVTFDIEDPPAQVRKRAFELARPSVPVSTFDIEDHPSTGQKTGFLSSPVLKGFGQRPRGLLCLYSFHKPATTSIIVPKHYD